MGGGPGDMLSVNETLATFWKQTVLSVFGERSSDASFGPWSTAAQIQASGTDEGQRTDHDDKQWKATPGRE
ncbi:hypothetical protein MLD38_005779 [Melastoma candidum]|uniref:Uncharacterized protein n=1 Tax=Melastoma candidum TaxID=119954 RepID=A0ACB9RPG1_9MYRT|nr:hypothetical protein MLD38_005779 [Melastoma candidum]